MESFSEVYASKLLSKEWLLKVDPATSTPYLLKFDLSESERFDASPTCCIMVTDTKRVWTEVLTSNEFARRWSRCNGGDSSSLISLRRQRMDALNSIHTIGGLEECSFESVSSSYSDMAFDIEYTDNDGQVLKWRWETNFEGYKFSSQLLSQHLILPLLTLSHMSQSNEDGEDAKDIEKIVDKACRTARRALPIHLKNVFKAKLSATLCRVTAATNFVPDSQLPPVTLAAEAPEITLPTTAAEGDEEKQPATKSSPPPSPPSALKPLGRSPVPEKATSAITPTERDRSPTPARVQSSAPMDVDDGSGSSTESEENEVDLTQASQASRRRAPASPITTKSHATAPPSPPPKTENIDQKTSRSPSPPPSRASKATHSKPSSESSSEPKKLTKRAKPAISDSDESGDEHPSGTRGGAPKRGTRQPLRRGGKRF